MDFMLLDQAALEDITLPWQPAPSFDEFTRLEDTCMDELLRGCILPAHLLQGAPFEGEPPLPPPPAELLDPRFNTKDPK